MHLESCKSHWNGGVKVGVGGTFAGLCYGEVHSGSGKSPCNGGVKIGLGGRFAAQRVANRIVMVVSRWLGVVGLGRCARGKQIAL